MVGSVFSKTHLLDNSVKIIFKLFEFYQINKMKL